MWLKELLVICKDHIHVGTYQSFSYLCMLTTSYHVQSFITNIVVFQKYASLRFYIVERLLQRNSQAIV